MNTFYPNTFNLGTLQFLNIISSIYLLQTQQQGKKKTDDDVQVIDIRINIKWKTILYRYSSNVNNIRKYTFT